MKVLFAAASDVGRVRRINEDAFLADPSLGIFAIADGMGGHASGEIASQMAVKLLRESLHQAQQLKDLALSEDQTAILSSPAQKLINGFRLANQKIYESSLENESYRGMGTTLVAIYFSSPSPILAHVGDSRVYHLRNQTITQLTEDHSLIWEQYKKGLIPKEELAFSPYKNIITRALGLQPTIDVEVKEIHPQPGDCFLLCSDGLSDGVREEEMLAAVDASGWNLDNACKTLTRLANARGGKDNITLLLLRIAP